MKISVNKSESYLALIDFEKNLRIISLGEKQGDSKETFVET